eukprot:TRINITY_DN3010_c1_g2_i1.p1 TRINITY_DN3010_c1_g2~~TRINITY_DN3010_c1_g2_i1.p1  ORF type:complete len:439 (-),score=106.91 TRINITY_DN3010_c1_g2_i1:52-1266(-)
MDGTDPNSYSPLLVILQQNSLSAEKLVRNKKSKLVHVVVKNSPFVIAIGLVDQPLSDHILKAFAPYLSDATDGPGAQPCLDLTKLAFDCILLYDLDSSEKEKASAAAAGTTEKEVNYVTNKPFQYKVVSGGGTDRVDLEMRLKVLSSQHEDTFFKIKIVALDPITKKEISPLLKVISEPIKVISKPEQLKKRKNSKKRPVNDSVMEALAKIQAAQLENQSLIDRIFNSKITEHNMPILPHPSSANPNLSQFQNINNTNIHTSNTNVTSNINNNSNANEIEAIDPEEAFQNLMKMIGGLDKNERPTKLRKILSTANIGDMITRSELVELNDMFMTEGMQRDIGENLMMGDMSGGINGGLNILGSISMDCQCSRCPFKAELERIEMFYKDVFHMNMSNSLQPSNSV